QRRIDHAGARRIAAAGQLLHRAHQVVSVPRLVRDQLEQHQAQFARIEHPPPAAAPAAAPFIAPVPSGPVPAPAASAAAAEAHGRYEFWNPLEIAPAAAMPAHDSLSRFRVSKIYLDIMGVNRTVVAGAIGGFPSGRNCSRSAPWQICSPMIPRPGRPMRRSRTRTPPSPIG